MSPGRRQSRRAVRKTMGPVPTQSGRAHSELPNATQQEHHDALVRPDTFIQATRDAGYSSTAAALAELVDNSIQARATEIEISVRRIGVDGGHEGIEIAVADNGVGMMPSEVVAALRFGGSTRFGRREGMGRFGMGLPNASVSQARLVRLYSWQRGCAPVSACLDVDSVASRSAPGVVGPYHERLPAWVATPAGESGTLVVWERCDRVPYKRPGMLIRHLARELGRVYRNVLGSGLRVRLNGVAVQRIDPLRVTPRPPVPGDVQILPAVTFPFAPGSTRGQAGQVTVTFSLLPVEDWTGLSVAQKREYAITKGSGVSILRAGREIARGWYFMGTKRRENYDDWWRCEVSFSPLLDEHFGVSHTKQGVRPSPELTEILTPTIEAEARRLNRQVRQRFLALRLASSPAEARASLLHHRLAAVIDRSRDDNEYLQRSPGYSLSSGPMRARGFIDVDDSNGLVHVRLNQNHPFFRQLYSPARGSSRNLARAMDLWLLALGRAITELSVGTPGRFDELVRRWSDASALLLEES